MTSPFASLFSAIFVFSTLVTSGASANSDDLKPKPAFKVRVPTQNPKLIPVQTQAPHANCCGHTHSGHSAHAQGTQDAQAIFTTMDAFHDAIHGENPDDHHHPHGFTEILKSLAKTSTWKDWMKGFNFKRIGINAYRAYKIKSQDPKLREHTLNLAFLFPLSHAVEMLSGPIATTVASEFGASDTVVYSLGVIGGIISIPGLDPLCILIYSTYPLKPVQKTVTYLRKGMTRFAGFALSASGVNAVLARLTHFEDPLTLLEKRIMNSNSDFEVKFTSSTNPDGEVQSEVSFFQKPESEDLAVSNAESFPWLKLVFSNDQLRKVVMSEDSLMTENIPLLKNAIRHLHWNQRDAIEQVSIDLRKNGNAQHFFTESVMAIKNDVGQVFYEISFVPHSLPIPKERVLSFALPFSNSCRNLLRK